MRGVDPGPVESRRHATPGHQGEQPGADEERQQQPVEPHVDRQRRVQLDRVERDEPEHREEDGQHPRQERASCAASRRRRTRASGLRAARAGRAIGETSHAGACRTSGRRSDGAERPARARPAAERTKATMKVRPPITTAEPPFAIPARALPSWRQRHQVGLGHALVVRDGAQVVAQSRGGFVGEPLRLAPSTAPACRRRGSAPSGGPAPRAGTGAWTTRSRWRAARCRAR